MEEFLIKFPLVDSYSRSMFIFLKKALKFTLGESCESLSFDKKVRKGSRATLERLL